MSAVANFENTIAVCGGGLAGAMAVVALKTALSAQRRVIWLTGLEPRDTQALYGTVSAPSAYEFLRNLGLDEPGLIQNTGTSFSYGTAFENWPSPNGAWMQCHHLPFPNLEALPFQHHLASLDLDLEPFLVSANAARNGKFAHPPEDPRIPLSRAEYGYQFCASDLVALLRQHAETLGIDVLSGALSSIEVADDEITLITLETGDRISAGLYLDCTDQSRSVSSSLGNGFEANQSIGFHEQSLPNETVGPSCRLVSASESGWSATTHLQDRTLTLTVAHPSDPDAFEQGEMEQVDLGRTRTPWIGNCVALGQAAYTLQPLTPAPMMLLQADIERLLELVPIHAEMAIERREYNRRFNDDVSHADLFQNALFREVEADNKPYWEDAKMYSSSDALDRKISQFERRGLLAKYDLEPFNDEDWLILHMGMGRRVSQPDRQTDRASTEAVANQLRAMRQSIEQIVARMPAHHQYIQNMKRYLEKQKIG